MDLIDVNPKAKGFRMWRLRQHTQSGPGHGLEVGQQDETKDNTALVQALECSKALTSATRRSILRYVASARDVGNRTGRGSLAPVVTLSNAILASDFSHNMESWLTRAFNEGIPSVYDKAVDAVYNGSHIGGGQLHRLFDESHTVWGMWHKVHDALPNDTPLQEVWGFLTAYGKDLSSHVGMPLFGMSRYAYQSVADRLSDSFHIPKPWFQDLLLINGVEVMGASIAALAVALRWNKAETQEFSRLVGSLGISSVVSANPALAVVALATLASAFMRARKTGDYSEVVDGLAKGGLGTGLFLATSSLVGGPVWVGILTGLCVGTVVNRATAKVDVHELSRLVEKLVWANLPPREVAPQPGQ